MQNQEIWDTRRANGVVDQEWHGTPAPCFSLVNSVLALARRHRGRTIMKEEEATTFMDAAAQMEYGKSKDGKEDAEEDTDGGDQPAKAAVGSRFPSLFSRIIITVGNVSLSVYQSVGLSVC